MTEYTTHTHLSPSAGGMGTFLRLINGQEQGWGCYSGTKWIPTLKQPCLAVNGTIQRQSAPFKVKRIEVGGGAVNFKLGTRYGQYLVECVLISLYFMVMKLELLNAFIYFWPNLC